MLISIKATSSHEGNFRTERIRNSGAQFFVCLVETFGATRASRRNVHLVPLFSEIMNQANRVPKMSFSCANLLPSREIKLTFVQFYSIATQSSLSTIFCAPKKDVSCKTQMCPIFFQPLV